jgi:hypothetical protein
VGLPGKTEKTHTWSHPVVPLGGTVRSQSVDSTMSMVLLELGTGASTDGRQNHGAAPWLSTGGAAMANLNA